MISLRRIMPWAVLAFVLFFIIKKPADAAKVASAILGGLGSAADGIGTFLANLA